MELSLDSFDSETLPDVPGQELPTEAPEAEETVDTAAADETVEAAGDETEPDAKEEAAKKVAAAVVAAGGSAKPVAKELKFKTDSGEVPLVETAEIEWKVDGKPEKIKVRELLDNWSGKVSYDRKFQELSTQKKGFQEESGGFERTKERHKSLINDMHRAVQEGRTFDAVANMLEMTGLDKQVDTEKYVGELREALVKQAQALAGMSPEQRQIQAMKEKQEHQTAKYNRLTQQRDVEQAEKAYHTRVTTAIESVKSSPDEFVQTRDFMLDFYKKEGRDPAGVTPEAIAAQIRDVRDFGTVKRAMEAVDPNLTKNQNLWKQSVEMMRANPTWTEEDVKSIFQKAVGATRSEAISKKIAKQPVSTVAKGAAKGRLTKQSDPEDFSTFSKDEVAW